MSDITAIPYRTPACDFHLVENEESDTCPWCDIDALQARIAKAATFRDRVAFVVNHAGMSDEAYAVLIKAIEEYDAPPRGRSE